VEQAGNGISWAGLSCCCGRMRSGRVVRQRSPDRQLEQEERDGTRLVRRGLPAVFWVFWGRAALLAGRSVFFLFPRIGISSKREGRLKPGTAPASAENDWRAS